MQIWRLKKEDTGVSVCGSAGRPMKEGGECVQVCMYMCVNAGRQGVWETYPDDLSLSLLACLLTWLARNRHGRLQMETL